MKNREKYQDIFLIAHNLFLEQGYESATIRAISDQAQVSLGLTNHFFHSKQHLAGLILGALSDYITCQCDARTSGNDLLLKAALSARVTNRYLLGGRYRRFYLDSLAQDIALPGSTGSPRFCLYELAEAYGFPADDDLFLLYEQYVPRSYEKTLVLGKEQGLFPTISYEEIPDYIMISRFEHFIDTQILNEALLKARKAADPILGRMPEVIPDDVLLEYLDRMSS
ncbi:MAG: TetR/AcrR family transcriptional regulator [Hungatella sp.]|nr:TetR/AcrR family transcriptional regulator [Hungatella sp.]